MRPQRLIMEGFLAYRRRTEIDFTDADLFVLAGPTGSGKSSVIDGMTALYGSIPRRQGLGCTAHLGPGRRWSSRIPVLDRRRATPPSVSSCDRAQGPDDQARLLHGEGQEVLAGTADEVTDAVTDLLGLRYEHFIKAVVLPQGAFADFLTDQPRDRQALLGALLEMGLYEQVMQLANQRAKLAEARAKTVGDSLAKLDVVSPEQLDEASRILAELGGARMELPARLGEDPPRGLAGRGSAIKAAAAVESLTRLRAIDVPEDLETLDTDRVSAAAYLESVEKSLVEAVEVEGDRRGDRGSPTAGQSGDGGRTSSCIASSSAGGRNSPSNRSQRPSTRSPQIAMNCDVLPKRSASSMRLTTCVEVSLPVTPARCDRWLPRLQRRATSRMCRSICSPPSCGKWRIRRIARDDLKEAEGQAKQIDHQLEELGQRLDGAADLEAIEEAIVTVGRLVQSKAPRAGGGGGAADRRPGSVSPSRI